MVSLTAGSQRAPVTTSNTILQAFPLSVAAPTEYTRIRQPSRAPNTAFQQLGALLAPMKSHARHVARAA